MRSIGARQGAFCFGYFYLGKQIKVTRTAVRKHKLNSATPLIRHWQPQAEGYFCLPLYPNQLALKQAGHSCYANA